MAETKTQQQNELKMERVFAAPRARVFEAWTDPAQIKKWFGPHGFMIEIAEVDLKPGGRFRLGMRAPDGNLYVVGGAYDIIDPPAKLTHSWAWEEGEMEGFETQVTVEFFEAGKETRVVITHQGFADAESCERHREGWTSQNDCLAEYLAKG